MALSKELTQKQQQESSDSESDEEMPFNTNKNSDNPWLSEKNPDETDEIFSGYRKFWEEKNANENALKKLKKMSENSSKSTEVKSNEISKIERSDEDVSEESDESMSNESEEDIEQNNSKSTWIEEDLSSENEDPNNFLNELFDAAEENINKKMESKLKQLKPKLLTSTSAKPGKKKTKRKGDKSIVKDAQNLEFAKEARIGDIDEGLLEGDQDDQKVRERLPPSKRLMNEIEKIKDEKKAFMRGSKDEIDPNSFLNVKSKHLLTALPKTHELDDADEDEMENLAAANKMSLAEAFENDDIIHDFVEDVEMESKKSQVDDENILPGWGSWGGEGVKNKKRLQDKKPEVKKKDRVIVNTTPHESLRKHLVSTVPFPFTTVKDFEASLRVPIGKDFIPASAHTKLTMEKVITKAGTVIEPMSEEALVKAENEKNTNKRKFMKNRMNKKPFVKKVK